MMFQNQKITVKGTTMIWAGWTFELTEHRKGDWVTVKAWIGPAVAATAIAMVGGDEWCAHHTGKKQPYQHPNCHMALIQAITQTELS